MNLSDCRGSVRLGEGSIASLPNVNGPIPAGAPQLQPAAVLVYLHYVFRKPCEEGPWSTTQPSSCASTR